MRHPFASITMEGGARIVLELYPEEAPNTVNSFIWLAQRGCFDNHAIERLVPDFVVDVSYTAFGRDDAKYLIPFETQSAGFDNRLGARPGTVVMGGYENGIAGGEFFFPLKENDRVTWNYPAFGKIIEGLDIILSWNSLPVINVHFPQDPSVKITVPSVPLLIRSVTVETFGINYPEPVRIDGAKLPVNWAKPEGM